MQLSWEGVVGSNSKGCGKWMENGRLFFHGFSALRESPSVWNFGTSWFSFQPTSTKEIASSRLLIDWGGSFSWAGVAHLCVWLTSPSSPSSPSSSSSSSSPSSPSSSSSSFAVVVTANFHWVPSARISKCCLQPEIETSNKSNLHRKSWTLTRSFPFSRWKPKKRTRKTYMYIYI